MAMVHFSEAYTAAQETVRREKFPDDWSAVIDQARKLLANAECPDAAQEIAVAALRKKLVDDAKPVGATPARKASQQIVGAAKDAEGINVKRAATLKLLKHLYLAGQSGSQTLWVYAPPKGYSRWVYDEIEGLSEAEMKSRLDDEAELYSAEHRKIMAEALQQASRACGKAQADLGIKPGAAGVDSKTTALVQKWVFGGDAATKEDMASAINRLRNGFRDIAVACRECKVIFSDEPTYRALPGKWENFGMIRPSEEMMVIYMMKGFLDEAGKPKAADRWLCVETIIHELSHKVLKTEDYAYDFHGLKPGSAKFAAGAGLDNADSWGYFACELNGILPSSEEAKVYVTPSNVLKVWSK